jgi:putative ABC transport system permease protein
VTVELAPSRLLPADVVRVGAIGLRTRRLRAALSALGIAIGIAAMVSVLGISESSRSDLISTLDRLGTNLLKAAPGQTILGEDATLPEQAGAMIGRIGPVQAVSSVEVVDATVRRTGYIDKEETGGISVTAVDLNLLDTLGGRVRKGVFLNAATMRYPAVVLGSITAERLGLDRVGVNVWLGEQWFTVVGILEPLELAPDLDRAALIGLPIAKQLFGAEGSASEIYVRARPNDLDDVRNVLAATANPEHSEEVEVSRPSDALEARAAAKTAFTSLFLGLGAVALLVGGVGIANVMVISVLERRSEIGLRRALGATKAHIRLQFLTESLILAGVGGAAGIVLGTVITVVYASNRGWDSALPWYVPIGGITAALAIGAVAGLYPAMRAARLAPTEALRST